MNTGVMSLRDTGDWRRVAISAVLGLGAAVILARAYELQVVQRDFLTREGDKRAVRTVAVPAHRGAIRDRRGEPLALSAPVESLWVIPSELMEAPEYLPALSKLLDYRPGELKKFLRERDDRHFVYLRRQMDPDEARRVLALGAPGVFSQREYRRYYPAGEVTGHVVGFCDIDGRGQEGMESAQDELLRGKSGARRVIRDRNGRVVEENGDFDPAQPGQDLALTLDLHLQYLAYRELKATVAEQRAKGGLVVVVDAASGEILAMAVQPGFNPNRPDDRDSIGLRNRAVTDVFEPGSTIKPLLMAQAFELGVFSPGSRVDVGDGLFKVGPLTVHDEHRSHGTLDFAHILSFSSNVGAAHIGLRLGAESVWSGYQKFAIGEPVRAGFPGEAPGVLRPYRQWGQVATATASYGYGLNVNALQLVRAYSALAHDGLLPQLRLVMDAAPGASGGGLKSFSMTPPEKAAPVAQRAVSAKVAAQVRRLMEDVTVGEGTGVKAAVAGYRVAGKTGTVRKPTRGGYHDDKHQSVFIGLLPAKNPRLVGLVMIDEPSKEYYGGQVAAPVFARVMQGAARLLQLPPDDAAAVAGPRT